MIKENMNQDDLIVLEQLLSQDEDIFEEIERENSYLNKILEELINNEVLRYKLKIQVIELEDWTAW